MFSCMKQLVIRLALMLFPALAACSVPHASETEPAFAADQPPVASSSLPKPPCASEPIRMRALSGVEDSFGKFYRTNGACVADQHHGSIVLLSYDTVQACEAAYAHCR